MCGCRLISEQHANIFEASELEILRTSLAIMQNDIRLQYQEALGESHHGRPVIIEQIHTGEPGRPRIWIDPDFLRWAYGHRSINGIARYLGVTRSVVRNALIEHGISEPQQNPFPVPPSPDPQQPDVELPQAHDDLLDPDLSTPDELPSDLDAGVDHSQPDGTQPTHPISFTNPLSEMTDEELDNIVIRLRSHYRRAGISMLDGMLRRLGHHVPRERVRLSLIRIDPVQRVFARIRIRRRVYSVPGPNSLWHHDGQHGQSPLVFHPPMFYQANNWKRSHSLGNSDPWLY